jgi:hypothetical protein
MLDKSTLIAALNLLGDRYARASVNTTDDIQWRIERAKSDVVRDLAQLLENDVEENSPDSASPDSWAPPTPEDDAAVEAYHRHQARLADERERAFINASKEKARAALRRLGILPSI